MLSQAFDLLQQAEAGTAAQHMHLRASDCSQVSGYLAVVLFAPNRFGRCRPSPNAALEDTRHIRNVIHLQVTPPTHQAVSLRSSTTASMPYNITVSVNTTPPSAEKVSKRYAPQVVLPYTPNGIHLAHLPTDTLNPQPDLRAALDSLVVVVREGRRGAFDRVLEFGWDHLPYNSLASRTAYVHFIRHKGSPIS